MKDWKEEAERLYKGGEKITDIAASLGRSRKSVSGCINALPDLAEIQQARKETELEARKKYKRRWKCMSSPGVDAALLRRQHNIDVAVLSRDRCYDE